MRLGLSAVLGVTTALFAAQAHAECGNVTIANMNWQSAELIANVDKLILETGYGCTAELVTGDTVPSITSMVERGAPTIIPEAWIDLMPEIASRGIEEGRIAVLGDTLAEGGQQGIFIPSYVAEAHPEIRTLDDAFARPDLFPSPERNGRAGLMNGPQGWGSVIVVSQLFKAFGAEEKGFDLIDPGSAAGLDGSMIRAYEREEPWIGQYWTPTAMLGRYNFVRLDNGVPHDPEEWVRCTTNPDCPDPRPNAWPTDEVKILATTEFAETAGPEVDYLKSRQWKNDDVNMLLAWMTDNQAAGEDGALEFIREYESIWSEWVTPEAAERLKATY